MWGYGLFWKETKSEVILLLGRALRSLLGMSFNMANFSSLSQGQPGSPGLKGESGDLGPQVISYTI